MIVYRPHRGTLSAALKEERKFNTIDELIQYVYDDWRKLVNWLDGKPPLKKSEIIIGEIIGDDPRCGWKNVRHVCVTRMASVVYNHPQCIGWCGERE